MAANPVPPPLPPVQSRRPIRAALRIVSAALLLGFVALIGSGFWKMHLDRQQRSQRERIDHWLRSRLERPPPGADAHEWRNVVSMLINTVGNAPIYYRQFAPIERVRAVADHLDQTHGADLDSLLGTMRLATRIENICPNMGRNGALETLRQWQAEGELPIPPEERNDRKSPPERPASRPAG